MELPKRKSPRLKGYDYSQNGAYFITICTHNRKHLFSNIVDAPTEPSRPCTDDMSGRFLNRPYEFSHAHSRTGDLYGRFLNRPHEFPHTHSRMVDLYGRFLNRPYEFSPVPDSPISVPISVRAIHESPEIESPATDSPIPAPALVRAIHESPVSESPDPDSPENKLTPYGEYVKQIIETLPSRFDVSIPKYVIMPNHIHLIIEIHNDNAEKRVIRESPLQRHRSVIDKTVGYLKMNVSKQIHKTNNEKIWQRSYHDHIIRNENDYRRIWEYIDANPLKWKLDCFYNNERSQ